MQAVIKYYRNNKEVDVQASVKATIVALKTEDVFTVEEVVKALHEQAPDCEMCNDLEWLTGLVLRLVAGLFSNEMTPFLSDYLCIRISEGRYKRR
jgi:hypothetical protein